MSGLRPGTTTPLDQARPAGNPIVFLHGGGLSARSWEPIVVRLPEFHCLAPNLPGHGITDQPLPAVLRSVAPR
jgi:pimeloyl-ACP methyl ester carboxylesterase